MTQLRVSLLSAAAVALGVGFIPAAATAQSGQQVSEIIVYGNDPCPRSTDDEVVVCARRPEAERYRIPETLRTSGPRQARESWAVRARSLETVGTTGINSCSPVGPGGFTGCLTQVINQARGERGETVDADTPPPQ